MQTETIVYMCIAGVAALLIAAFQYLYKSKLESRLKYSFFVLRALTLFIIGLLLINPKFESSIFYNEKPNLILAVDNSESISYLDEKANATRVVAELKTNEDLNVRFNIAQYSFGQNLSNTDSLQFNERLTDISKALENLGNIYKGSTSPVVMVTDGNQTLGIDYSFGFSKIKQPLYPVVLGDSSIYMDVSIKQLNVNRYAFLKNRFPIEAILNYSGEEPISTEFRITENGQLLFKKKVEFNKTKTSEIVSTTLLANKVGIKSLKAELLPIDNERNIANNIKNFGVEVIDQKTNIAIVSERIHPDLGALKKAIQSNEQRKADVLKPVDFVSSEEDYQLVIVYQPNRSFEPVFTKINEQRLNVLYITGTTTDWSYVNQLQDDFRQAQTYQTEDYQALLNSNYSNFIVPDLDFSDFPPLRSEFGDFGINRPNDVLLYKTVNGISTDLALLATFENENLKYGILNGEDIWRWRAHSYLVNQSFEPFDNFVGKLIQYLSSTKRRSRLQVDYKSFYDGNAAIVLNAQYFNKSYEFDADAALTLELSPLNEDIGRREYPFLVSNGNYKVNLSGLEAGRYNFKVKHNSEAISFSGVFEVLEYNVEQQFLNADFSKLNTLAEVSNGGTFFPSNIEDLINNLLADSRYSTVQKSSKNIVPLIDWNYLLVILALSLFFEWFTRKYYGLI